MLYCEIFLLPVPATLGIPLRALSPRASRIPPTPILPGSRPPVPIHRTYQYCDDREASGRLGSCDVLRYLSVVTCDLYMIVKEHLYVKVVLLILSIVL